MSANQKALLSLPTVSLAMVSIVCCIYVCVAIIKAGYVPFPCLFPCYVRCDCLCKCRCKCRCKRRKPHWQQQLSKSSTISSKPMSQQSNMIDIIFWMCCTDCCWNIFIVLNWMPLSLQSFGFDIAFWRGRFCTFLGVYAQIASVQSPLWHLILAYNLGFLLIRGTLNSLNKLYYQRCYQYTFVIITPILLAILPAFFTKYGIYENNNSFDKECWIVSEEWQLLLFGTILLSLLFHYIILTILCCKYQKYRNYGNSKSDVSASLHTFQYKSIISRLSRFVFVYTLIRILPTMERIWECFTIGPPPFWLIVGHHICVSVIGIANFIAWNINQMDPNTTLSSKETFDINRDLLTELEEDNTLCLNSKNNTLTTATKTPNKSKKHTFTTPDTYNNTLKNEEEISVTSTTTNVSELDSKFIWNPATIKT